MKILVVSAHPDDEIIGMGGTLKKLTKHHDVFVLFLADGITARKKSGHVNVVKYDVDNEENKKMNKEIEIRKKHAQKALSLVDVTKMEFLDLPDNELDTVPFLKITKEVEKIILEFKPKILFTHHHNDLNIDHRIAYEACITASRPIFKNPISTIISFEAVSSTDWKFPYQFNPNLFIEITNELKSKIASLKIGRAHV